MKKVIILLFLLTLLFGGCAQSGKIPESITETSFDAVYTFGDFSFKCNIKWQNQTAFVTVTSTSAAGMTISCDGREVVFTKGTMLRRESYDKIDASNPARLLYEIFTALENGGNKTSLGDFDITYRAGKIEQITVADIVIKAV